LIIIPSAAAAEPHPHKRYETVIYLLKGRVDTRYGQQLENSVICEEGDFISPHLMPRSVVVKRTKTVWVDEQQRERVAH
jgi:uncharacterized RmlC-like cupin family protein